MCKLLAWGWKRLRHKKLQQIMLSIVKKGLQVREVFFMLSVLVFQLQYRFCVLPEKTTLIWLSCGHMVTYLLGYSEHAKGIHAVIYALIMTSCWLWLQDTQCVICCNVFWHKANWSKECELVYTNSEFILKHHFASYSSSFLFLHLVQMG